MSPPQPQEEQERPHITPARIFALLLIFFLNGKHFLFPNAISFNQIIAEPKKVAYLAVLWVFSLLSLNPSTQLLEELRLGPFKCK